MKISNIKIDLFHFSKTDFDKQVEKITKKRITESRINEDEDDKDTEPLDDDLNADKDESDEIDSIAAYTGYITEVISAFMIHSNPSVDFDQVIPKINNVAKTIIQVTKQLYKV